MNTADFENASYWDTDVSDDNLIGPGDTVYFTGTIAIGTGEITIPGSGSASGYIFLDFDDGTNPVGEINPTNSGSNVTIDLNGKDYIHIKDAVIDGGNYASIGNLGGSSSDYIKIENVTIEQDVNYAIFSQFGHDWEIFDCTITKMANNGSDAIFFRSDDGTIYNIEVHNNTISDWRHSGVSFVAYDYDIHDHKIYNNKFLLPNRGYGRAWDSSTASDGAYCSGSVCDGETYNFYVYNNYHSGMRAPSQIAKSNHSYIYNNIFREQKNCCDSGLESGCSEAYSTCISSHSYFSTGQAIVVHTAQGPVSYIYIYNNTFYNTSESAIQVRDQADTIDNVHIKNNIIENAAIYSDGTSEDPDGSTCSACDYAIISIGGTGITNEDIDNNIIYGSDGANDVYWEATAQTLNDFSFADDNQEADPLMTDPANEDFTLQSGSPVINAGVNLGADYDECWDPNTSLPPTDVTTVDQDAYGSWEIGVFGYLIGQNPKFSGGGAFTLH